MSCESRVRAWRWAIFLASYSTSIKREIYLPVIELGISVYISTVKVFGNLNYRIALVRWLKSLNILNGNYINLAASLIISNREL